MAAAHNQAFSPSSFPELFSFWARYPDSVPYAGGAELVRNQGRRLLSLPQNILSLDKIAELRHITRTERYLELGAMVRLTEIIHLGKIVPEILILCLQGIAGPHLRNIATIGGNICAPCRGTDAAAPMIALDAHYELRTAAGLRWISASRFSSLPGSLALEKQELLTRIRIPLEQWTYSRYHKFGNSGSSQGAIVFILRNQKNILTDLRVVYGGKIILRDKNSESLLGGKKLPLEKKDARNFLEHWQNYLGSLDKPASPGEIPDPGDRNSGPPKEDSPGFSMPDQYSRTQILNFIETALMEITD
jgi:CO/xanthine dehydrogenase FAD-binding subunit